MYVPPSPPPLPPPPPLTSWRKIGAISSHDSYTQHSGRAPRAHVARPLLPVLVTTTRAHTHTPNTYVFVCYTCMRMFVCTCIYYVLCVHASRYLRWPLANSAGCNAKPATPSARRCRRLIVFSPQSYVRGSSGDNITTTQCTGTTRTPRTRVLMHINACIIHVYTTYIMWRASALRSDIART